MSEPVPRGDSDSAEAFARASGIDPDNVPVLHAHLNPETGKVATASWPCRQCAALGRTEPFRYGKDFPDEGGPGPMTEIPPERLGAYLASFDPPPGVPAAPQVTGGHRARRKARRKAQRKARRHRREP